MLVLLPVSNSKNRHKPGKLVDHPDIRIYNQRADWNTWTWSVCEATTDKRNFDADMRKTNGKTSSICQLARRIQVRSAYNGCTKLHAVTYKRIDTDDMPIMLRIAIAHNFQLAGGEPAQYSTMYYDFRLADFQALATSKYKDCFWLKNLSALIDRSTDSAYLNVEAALRHWEAETDDPEWLPPRGPDIKQAFGDVLARKTIRLPVLRTLLNG